MLGRRNPSSAEELLERPQGQSLIHALEAALELRADPLIESFINYLRRSHRVEPAAVIFYGSCLFQQTRTATSFPDFYLLTEDPWRFYPSRWHASLSLVLPPNVYYARFRPSALQLPGLATRSLSCKYCVISLQQFARETSPAAHDVHHLGRFSKRFALAYSRNPAVRQAVARGSAQAILSLLPLALALLPERFTLEQLILQLLSLSYLGEQRVAEPDKVQRLFDASAEHYRQVFRQALELLMLERPEIRAEGETEYRQPPPSAADRRATAQFLQLSRLRGVLRWPKYILTVDNWLQYILDKLERHQGIRLELTERERRYPLIFGWRKFFALKRQGAVG